jgi:hypothetical protein
MLAVVPTMNVDRTENWWTNKRERKREVFEENLPSDTLSTTNPTSLHKHHAMNSEISIKTGNNKTRYKDICNIYVSLAYIIRMISYLYLK